MGGNSNAAAALMKFGDFDTFVSRLFKTRLVVKWQWLFFFFVKTGVYAVCVCARMRVCMFISYVIFVT